MGFHLGHIFALLTLAVVALASQAALPVAQLYWNSVLPNTQMPKAISELLQPAGILYRGESKWTQAKVGNKDAKKMYAYTWTPAEVGNKDAKKMYAYTWTPAEVGNKDAKKMYAYKWTPAEVGNKDAKKMYAYTWTPAEVGNKDAKKMYAYKWTPAEVGNQDAKKMYAYAWTPAEVGNSDAKKMYAYSTEDHQFSEDPKAAALVFLEKNIRPGTTMNWPYARNTNAATFLPRRTAESIPFSSTKLPEILKHFSLEPSSVEANTIKETIQLCEAPAIKGEEKYCATSLESMIDFTASKIGTSVEALVSTEEEKEATVFMHKYTIMPGVKKLEGEKAVMCHKQDYPYAVFYCHAMKQTRAYIVPLVGADGVKAKAVAVCHIDTSEWNPKHLAFQVLKVKPGTVPICHFLTNDHIVWVPKSI